MFFAEAFNHNLHALELHNGLKFWGSFLFGIWHSFFIFNLKIHTSKLIFPDFKVPSKSFFPKDFKIGLTFWHMWFFNFQNLVRSCQHNGGTPCIRGIMELSLCWRYNSLNFLLSMKKRKKNNLKSCSWLAQFFFHYCPKPKTENPDGKLSAYFVLLL